MLIKLSLWLCNLIMIKKLWGCGAVVVDGVKVVEVDMERWCVERDVDVEVVEVE